MNYDVSCVQDTWICVKLLWRLCQWRYPEATLLRFRFSRLL